MRIIHMTRQFFGDSGRHGDLIEKPKNLFLDKVNGISFRSVSFFVQPGGVTHIHTYTNKKIHTYTSEIRNILDRLLS